MHYLFVDNMFRRSSVLYEPKQQALYHDIHWCYWQWLIESESITSFSTSYSGIGSSCFFLCNNSKIAWEWDIWIHCWCYFLSKMFLIGKIVLFLGIFPLVSGLCMMGFYFWWFMFFFIRNLTFKLAVWCWKHFRSSHFRATCLSAIRIKTLQ